MDSRAKYLIAQYVSDPFRREPRNIGVVVEKEGTIAARFWGEKLPGEIDGRQLKRFNHPEVYRQWIDYWRDVVGDGDGTLERLVTGGGSHFRMIEGGEVSDTGADPVTEVVEYLYSLLVSEGGFAEAIASLGEQSVGTARVEKLGEEVTNVLQALSILAESENDMFVPHPVRLRAPVSGQAVDVHRPELVQENGRLYVMETIDFSTRATALPREHAGRTAYMFADLRRAHGKLDPISIVRFPEEAVEDENVFYGMKMLKAESEVVVWGDKEQRESFIAQRREVALSAG